MVRLMTNEEIRQLKYLLESAVSAAYAEPNLVERNDEKDKEGYEQTFAFRVGIHLHELLKRTEYSRLNLDCEYNKHGDDPKKTNGKGIRPDLLIHSRGNDDENILAVEFAGWWQCAKKFEKDKEKLEGLTQNNGDYRYSLGALVKIEKDNPTYTYFQNGN